MKILDLQSTDPYFEGSITLDGILLTIELGRDLRADRWYFVLRDENDAVLVAGRRLVSGFDLFNGASDPRLPPGELRLTTLRTDFGPARGDELGTVATLAYLTPEDVAALELFVELGQPLPVTVVIS